MSEKGYRSAKEIIDELMENLGIQSNRIQRVVITPIYNKSDYIVDIENEAEPPFNIEEYLRREK